MKTYYFDYNATTPVAPEVWQAMEPYLKEHYGNPSSIHQSGQVAAKAIRQARRQVASLVGARDENEIVFTSGGTESNNAAIRSCLALKPGKKQIVTSAVEHSSIFKLCLQLEKEGYQIRWVGVDQDGRLDLDQLKGYLTDETAVVSLMMANNETGVLFQINEIGKGIKEREIFFHVDAVQAIGKHHFDLSQCPVDFLSLSAHKFYGPKGIGALYVCGGIPFQPLIYGGAQERGRRAGTENAAGIVGFGMASELVKKDLPGEILRLANLQFELEGKIIAQIQEVAVNGKNADRLPNTSNLRFKGIDGEALLFRLDQRGVYASSGSACMSGSHEPSRVLKKMGLEDEEANASLRLSFGRYTTQTDIQALIAILSETIQHLRDGIGIPKPYSHSAAV